MKIIRDHLPDFLDLPALLDLDIPEEDALAVLRGQSQLQGDELDDRLELRRWENGGRP